MFNYSINSGTWRMYCGATPPPSRNTYMTVMWLPTWDSCDSWGWVQWEVFPWGSSFFNSFISILSIPLNEWRHYFTFRFLLDSWILERFFFCRPSSWGKSNSTSLPARTSWSIITHVKNYGWWGGIGNVSWKSKKFHGFQEISEISRTGKSGVINKNVDAFVINYHCWRSGI